MACKHHNIHFSRVLCACDTMHNYCGDCGKTMDDCPYEDDEPSSRWTRPFRLFTGRVSYYRHTWGPLCWTCTDCCAQGRHRDRTVWRVLRKEGVDD